MKVLLLNITGPQALQGYLVSESPSGQHRASADTLTILTFIQNSKVMLVQRHQATMHEVADEVKRQSEMPF